jgi:hypothetical protein
MGETITTLIKKPAMKLFMGGYFGVLIFTAIYTLGVDGLSVWSYGNNLLYGGGIMSMIGFFGMNLVGVGRRSSFYETRMHEKTHRETIIKHRKVFGPLILAGVLAILTGYLILHI